MKITSLTLLALDVTMCLNSCWWDTSRSVICQLLGTENKRLLVYPLPTSPSFDKHLSAWSADINLVPEAEGHPSAMEGDPGSWKQLSREFRGVELLFLPWAAGIWYFLFYSTSLKKSWLWPTWLHNTLMGHKCRPPLKGKFQMGQEYWRTGREYSVIVCIGCCFLLSRVLREQGTHKQKRSSLQQR